MAAECAVNIRFGVLTVSISEFFFEGETRWIAECDHLTGGLVVVGLVLCNDL